VQKPEVAGAPEALGQDMLEQQPEEGGAGERSRFAAASFAVAVAKGDLAVVAGEDVLFLEHAPVQIAAQIDQSLFPGADVLAVHDPLPGMGPRQGHSGLGKSCKQLGSVHLRQCLVVEQIALAGLGAPQFFVGVDGGGRHHTMDVGVIVQAAGMGMEHRHGAGRALKLLVVAAEGQQRLPGALHQQAIERLWMGQGQGAKFRRQGEGQQEVRAGHQRFPLPFQPLLALVVLAVGTQPVAAGMGHEDLLFAVGTVRLHPGAERSAAGFHGR